MVTVVFRNLDKSDLTKESVITRLHDTIDRFPDLARHRITANVALADVNENLLERLNRMGDRTRVKLRRRQGLLLEHSEEVEEEL